jgi:hypothetical protein
MQKIVLFALLSASSGSRIPGSAFQARGIATKAAKAPRATAAKMDSEAELKDLANKLNPAIGYWDPLNLVDLDIYGQGKDATIGFLRHSEIKHGRVAMAAFVGYLVGANGITWPWRDIPFEDGRLLKVSAMKGTFAEIAAAGSPPEQWDAVPAIAKVQFFHFIGFLEFWSESSIVLEKDGLKHYMRGGQPGKFPSFDAVAHPVPLPLYDPFRLNADKTREQLDKSLLAEINNGRLAMIGIMSLLAEQAVPGSVPYLQSAVPGLNLKPYAGEIMAPFAASDGVGQWPLPLVTELMKPAYHPFH